MDLSKEFQKEITEYLKKIEKRCKEILEQSIVDNVYNAYSPSEYQRTDQLRNSVRTKIEDNKLFVYIDDTLNYHSNINREKYPDEMVSKMTPYWVNYGHHTDKDNPIPIFDDYDGRYFIEKAINKIKEEFGDEVIVNVVNDSINY